MRVAFDFHELADTYTAGYADAPDIVAAQINQHDMFGALLGIIFQFLLELLIALRVCSSRTSSGNGMDGHNTILDAH